MILTPGNVFFFVVTSRTDYRRPHRETSWRESFCRVDFSVRCNRLQRSMFCGSLSSRVWRKCAVDKAPQSDSWHATRSANHNMPRPRRLIASNLQAVCRHPKIDCCSVARRMYVFRVSSAGLQVGREEPFHNRSGPHIHKGQGANTLAYEKNWQCFSAVDAFIRQVVFYIPNTQTGLPP